MAQTPDGFAPKAGVLEECVARIGGAKVRALDPLIDSSAATPVEWNRIADAVAQAGAYDRIVIVHGTDTMAYTAAALTFALQGLDRPVILTGSMLPLTVPGNDGEQNMHDALAAAQTARPGVWLSFAGRLLHGARVRKVNSQAFSAFDASDATVPPKRLGPLNTHPFTPHDLAVLTVTPGMNAGLLTHVATTSDAIILRCFGSGTLPDTPDIRAALANAATRSIPVIAISQCGEGGVSFGTYAAGSALVDHGVIDGKGMTAEAAYVKTMLALGTPNPTEFIRMPLAGEME